MMMLHEWKNTKRDDNDMQRYDTIDLRSNVGFQVAGFACRMVQ
jgi:hypothetical protein